MEVLISTVNLIIYYQKPFMAQVPRTTLVQGS